MTGFEVRNLMKIRIGLDRHNQNCPKPARAILLNPVDHQLLGFSCLWGIPVLADACVDVKRVQIDCEGSAERIEEELADHLDFEADLDPGLMNDQD
jgi:hypothetical protein